MGKTMSLYIQNMTNIIHFNITDKWYIYHSSLASVIFAQSRNN